jgi:hypothetical protein
MVAVASFRHNCTVGERNQVCADRGRIEHRSGSNGGPSLPLLAREYSLKSAAALLSAKGWPKSFRGLRKNSRMSCELAPLSMQAQYLTFESSAPLGKQQNTASE